jgi:4-hydroxybenzoate polyprenyltransferase
VVPSDSLLGRFGAGNFDYVGCGKDDLGLWHAARLSHVVGGSPALHQKVREHATLARVFSVPPRSAGHAMLRAMRPHQWAKNILVLIPLLTAHRYTDAHSVLQVLLAFLTFGLTASSVYLLNDLIDVADDRHHPRKRLRPIAAGELGLLQGWLAWPLLLCSAWLLALATLPINFLITLAVYIALTLGYSLRLKQSPIVDVLALACLYTLRIIAGAAAINVPLSFWLLSFSMFIFLSLAFIKRFNELRTARANHAKGNLRGRGYRHEDLEMVSSLGISAGYLSVLVLALYIQDGHTAQMYARHQVLWLACPTMLFWISRTWMIANRGWMHDDPIVFALKDKTSLATAAILVLIFAVARLMP